MINFGASVVRRRRRRRRVRVVIVRVNSMDWLNERFSNDCRAGMRRGGCARSLAGFARGRFFFFFPWCARALVVGWLRAGRGVGMSCGGGGGRPASLLRAPPVTDDDREPPPPSSSPPAVPSRRRRRRARERLDGRERRRGTLFDTRLSHAHTGTYSRRKTGRPVDHVIFFSPPRNEENNKSERIRIIIINILYASSVVWRSLLSSRI